MDASAQRPNSGEFGYGVNCWAGILLVLGLFVFPVPFASAQTPLPSPLQAEPIAAPTAEATTAAAVPTVTSTAVPHAANPSMLQILGDARRGFCARVRQSPIGKLAAGMRKPLSMATGGMVPAEKPPHPDEKAQPGPEGTAAQVKTVKLQAPKRQQAIAELKHIDVRYHPEVEATLIAALRADPSECVRLEAAITIATLPVCSPAIRKALTVCVESKDSDGNPVELSDRVKMRAAMAIAHCANCEPLEMNETLERPEYPGHALLEQSSLMQASATLPITAALAGEVTPTSLSAVAPAEIELSSLASPSLPAETPAAVATPVEKPPVQNAMPARPRPRNLLEVLQAAE